MIAQKLDESTIGQTAYSYNDALEGRMEKLIIVAVGKEDELVMCVRPNHDEEVMHNARVLSFYEAQYRSCNNLRGQIKQKQKEVQELESRIDNIVTSQPRAKDLALANDPNHEITVSISDRKLDDDYFGDTKVPYEGFKYLDEGSEVISMVNFALSSITIPAGSIGEVTEIRKPGSFKQSPGYIGCGVYFEAVREIYPHGLIIPWDMIHYFKFK